MNGGVNVTNSSSMINKFMNSTFVQYVKELVEIYLNKRVSRCAAELSYFLTLSIFPTLICVHAIIVYLAPEISVPDVDLNGLIPKETLKTISDYLSYVADNEDSNLLTAGLIGMATSSAAAFRSLHNTMADIQGKSRFRGVFSVIFSFVFSILFLVTIYFALIVMATGDWLINILISAFPAIGGLRIWSMVKFPILFVIFILIIYGMYRITAPRETKRGFIPGAVFAAFALVLVSALFSTFISLSTRYPLVYGSLASIIIFMLWMYICGQILIMCNAFNVVRRRRLQEKIIVIDNSDDE